MRRFWRISAYVVAGAFVAVQACLLAYTIAFSFRDGLGGPFSLANWTNVLLRPETWQLARNSLLLSLVLSAMIPICLSASAGLLSIRSRRLRVLCWGLFALPLALGPAQVSAAIRWMMGPAFEQGAALLVPMAYAMILHDLPLFLLVVILLDALWQPEARRVWGFLAVMGVFWALVRGFNVPFEVQQVFRVSGSEWARTLSPLSQFPFVSLADSRNAFLNVNMAFSFLSQLFTLAILAPMGYVAVRMATGMARAARRSGGLHRGAGLLLLPALAFSAAPCFVLLSLLPRATLLPSPTAQVLPTILSLVGGLLASLMALLLMRLLTLPGRVSARYAVWGCVVCGVFFHLALYYLIRGLTGDGSSFEPFVPLIAAVPPFGAMLVFALLFRLDKRIHRLRGFIGTGLLCIGYGLNATAFLDTLFIRHREHFTVPTIQLMAINAQDFMQEMNATSAAQHALVAPYFTLFCVALFVCAIALLASAFPAREFGSRAS